MLSVTPPTGGHVAFQICCKNLKNVQHVHIYTNTAMHVNTLIRNSIITVLHLYNYNIKKMKSISSKL